MPSAYSYELLPLDTPDDDPRWGHFLDVVRHSFLQPRASAEALAIFRQHRRSDNARLAMMLTETARGAGAEPVATFSAIGCTVNCGVQLVDALQINTITVRATHRRRGLLKEMMTRQLASAKSDGVALAVLTASEATIYPRFGFGPCSRSVKAEIDTRRFQLRGDAAIAPGVVEFVDPSFLIEHLPRIWQSHHERYRGSVSLNHYQLLADTGQWDVAEGAASKKLRAAVHFDEAGVPDGYAVFEHNGWDNSPITTDVHRVVAPDPAIERALWQSLASIDLVERLTYGLWTPETPLPLSLVDPWAVKTSMLEDWVWLRLLDLASATSKRRFDADGEVTIELIDQLGHIDGRWRLSAHQGQGLAERTTSKPEVTMSADTLARLWHGDQRATTLAQAGLIHGELAAIGRLTHLLATTEASFNIATF